MRPSLVTREYSLEKRDSFSFIATVNSLKLVYHVPEVPMKQNVCFVLYITLIHNFPTQALVWHVKKSFFIPPKLPKMQMSLSES